MSLPRVFIKNLPPLLTSTQLLGKLLEVEGEDAAGNPRNFSLSLGLLLQTLNERLVGPNLRPDLRKGVGVLVHTDTTRDQGYMSLADLDPRYLCLGCVCYVELPPPGEPHEYILVWDPTGPLQVYREATFAGEKVTARWVAKDSDEQYTTGFEEFNALTTRYNRNDTVRFTIGGVRRIFEARLDLIKTNYTPARIPAPTGTAADANWNEINPVAPGVRPQDLEALAVQLRGEIAQSRSFLESWVLDNDYQEGKVVFYQGRQYRGKGSPFNSQLSPDLDTANWEPVGGSGGDTLFDGNQPVTRGIPGLQGVTLGGDVLSEVVRNMLYPAVPPGASISLIDPQRENGDTRPLNYSWTATKQTNPITTILVNGATYPSTGQTQSGTGSAPYGTMSVSLQVTAGSLTSTGSAGVSYSNYRYWFTSGQNLLQDPGLSARLRQTNSREFSGSRQQVRTFTLSDEYVYFAYPVAFGAASFIVGGLPNTAYQSFSFNHINQYGYAEPYILYRSGGKGTGSITVQVQ